MKKIQTRLIIDNHTFGSTYIESLMLTQESSALCDILAYDKFEFTLIDAPFTPKHGDKVELWRDDERVLTHIITAVEEDGKRCYCVACDKTFFLQFSEFSSTQNTSELDGIFYSQETTENILQDVLRKWVEKWNVDWRVDNGELTGFVKFGKARDVLNNILFSAGLVKEVESNGRVLFKNLESNLAGYAHFFPHEKVFINPTINNSPLVKSVSVTIYDFLQTTNVQPSKNYVEYPDGVYRPYTKSVQSFESQDVFRTGSAVVANLLTITPLNASDVYNRILRQYATGSTISFDISEKFERNKYLNRLCVVDLKDKQVKGLCTRVVTTFGKTIDKQSIYVVGFEPLDSEDFATVIVTYQSENGSHIFEVKGFAVPKGVYFPIPAKNMYVIGDVDKEVYTLQPQSRTPLIIGDTTTAVNYELAAAASEGVLRLYSVDNAELIDGDLEIESVR